MNKVLLNSILMDIPLSRADYDTLYMGIIFMTILLLVFVIVYLMVGEEREETET